MSEMNIKIAKVNFSTAALGTAASIISLSNAYFSFASSSTNLSPQGALAYLSVALGSAMAYHAVKNLTDGVLEVARHLDPAETDRTTINVAIIDHFHFSR